MNHLFFDAQRISRQVFCQRLIFKDWVGIKGSILLPLYLVLIKYQFVTTRTKVFFFFNSIYMFMLPVHMLWMHAVLIISFCADEKEPCLLTSDSQRSVKALEWRPNGGKSISVACRWVLIWPPLNTIYFLLLGSFLYDQVTPASIETGEGYAYGLLPILVTWLWLELVVLHWGGVSLEDLELAGSWWIFSGVKMMSRSVLSLGALVEDILKMFMLYCFVFFC